jgi:hypothetical protein
VKREKNEFGILGIVSFLQMCFFCIDHIISIKCSNVCQVNIFETEVDGRDKNERLGDSRFFLKQKMI